MARSKREIDKEIMFNKIMPSGLVTAVQSEVVTEQDGTAEQASPSKAQEPSKPTLQKSVFASEAGVQFKDKNPTVIINIMERLVLEKLDSAFSKFNCCKCDRCKKDVVALALNKLTPKYVVAAQDKIRDFVAAQTNTEVTTALVQAIIMVRSNPRH